MSERKFITGMAGTGKTYQLMEAVKKNPKFAVVASTTGISAVNLGTTTINSLLGYFDTASLAELFVRGSLRAKLARLSKVYQYVGIDEISMMDADQLDIIDQAVEQLDSYDSLNRPISILATGDFCQLPPVKAKWAFQARCWDKFAADTFRLTKVWRQNDPKFLEAINHIRAGNGMEGATVLKEIPEVTWRYANDMDFVGTTIMGRNDQVDNFNWLAHNKLPGKLAKIPNVKWGVQRKEWKNIPDMLELREGAYVMILANSRDGGVMIEGGDEFGGEARATVNQLTYANGDCGVVKEIKLDGSIPIARVELKRNGDLVTIRPVERRNTTKYLEDHLNEKDYPAIDPDEFHWPPTRRTYYDTRAKVYVHGAIEFMPLRLAYAATVHKTQGLSLDNVQINLTDHFMSAKAMCYVAISRARTPQGLRLVGTPELLAARCCIAEEVRPWL